ncbi:kinase-like domain-containing protein [Gigaspora rosea]|uniref:Kinase-like domain-containing protein n=1 Tax=Gigaspora rosea TaxID=44941 RepID=A0A397UKB3_9GLOM|nr:kinase-like domain-containing protein [Gigaspora rosea]
MRFVYKRNEFSSRRNDSNGKCKYCEHYNTSPAWCQSCDPWKATQEWTSGNEEIDNFIKEFQFKTTEYEKVIEWIPFDKLIDLQEIKEINEESDLVFMASWVKGVRIIKGDTGKYMQSRSISSSVDLMNLNCSQTDTLELFENLKNHMQLGKYRIHGITQNTETGQYMIVIDFYSEKRKSINGNCKYCNRYNTSPVWCQLCDPRKVDQETSGDKNIDDCIKEFQLKATAFENVIEWKSLDREGLVQYIHQFGYIRYRNKSCEVALKTIAGSHKSSSEFLNEFKNHMQCRLKGSALEVYGLTWHTKTDQYMMVYQYANRGNFHDFLAKYFRKLVWQDKLKQLADISYDLSRIHKAGLIHNDFHSGNILLNQNIGGDIISYITDLGLSRKPGNHDPKEGIFGVMPYVAPEILLGQEYTREADIYGLGVMMAEVSTGKCPYEEYKFDTKLATKICKGLRPDFAKGTPDCYIELAKKCMDSNPQNRPSAEYINSKIKQWKKIIESENLTDKEELDIKKKFIDADNEIKEMTLKSLSVLQTKYCSTLIDVKEIIKSLKVLLFRSS